MRASSPVTSSRAQEAPGGSHILAAAVDFELELQSSARSRALARDVADAEIQALARELADAEIAPHATDWDREHRFPQEVFARLAEVGLMGVCVPEEYGGAGADFLAYVLVLEQLSRADAGVGVTVAVHTSATTLPILAWGTEEQKSRFVPPLARGRDDRRVRALGAGRRAPTRRACATSATRDGDGWVISGQKQWMTNASTAGHGARSSRARTPRRPARAGSRRSSLGAEHVQVTREEEKLGLNSSSDGRPRCSIRRDV